MVVFAFEDYSEKCKKVNIFRVATKITASLMMDFCLEHHSLAKITVEISVFLKSGLLFWPVS